MDMFNSIIYLLLIMLHIDPSLNIPEMTLVNLHHLLGLTEL
jgi:hypothetical protein